jgi:23S rRNA pseudouridine1911/1915/1917 synthase
MDTVFADGPEPRIIYSDDELLVVYKPQRLHTAPLAAGGGPDLVSWVFERFPGAAAIAGPEGGLIHRLDFETSGLVLFALTPEALGALRAEQEVDSIRKEYLLRASLSLPLAGLAGSRPDRGRPLGIEAGAWDEALLSGPSEGPAAIARLVGTALAQGSGPEIRCRFRTYGPASARVACIGEGEEGPRGRHRRGSPERLYRSEILSARPSANACPEQGEGLVEFRVSITRGFRHQIRAHFAWLGLPLIGDAAYGGLPADRLYLQARAIELDWAGDHLCFEA